MNDRELACGWAATASTATVILACGLATPRWWLAAMVFLTLATAVTRAATHTTTGSARVVVALRVIVLCVVLGLLVTLLASRSLAMASLFYLGIAPLLGTESLLVLVGCALVFVPVADPTQPYSVLARAVYVATWALVLLTAVVRASHRLRTPIAGYATLYTAGQQVSVSRAARRPLGWALAGALVAAAVVPLGPPRPVGLPASERSDGVAGGTAETARIDLAAVGDVDLGVRGEPRTDPVAVVPADSPQYWRSGLLSGYDGRLLTRRTPSDGDAPTLQTLLPNTDDGRTVIVPHPEGSVDADPAGPAVTYRVQPVEQTGGVTVIAPGTLRSVSPAAPARLIYDDQVVVVFSAEAHLVTAVPTPDLDEVTAFVSQPPSTPTALLATDDRWLALPNTVSSRTRDLARQITAGIQDRSQAVAAIRRYLTSQYAYDLQAPVPPEGQDSVDFFLFDSHRGYCVHFAAAELVLLRSLGIPARVATGYLGGHQDADQPGNRVITADRGHAWTEAYLPQAGWVRSDATPAGAVDATAAAGSTWPTPWSWLFAGWLVAAAAGWTVRRRLRAWWRRLRRTSRRPDPSDHPAPPHPVPSRDPELEQAYDRLEQALAQTSLPHAPTETLTELAVRLPQARNGLGVLSRSRYDAHELSPQDRTTAVATLDETVRALRAATRGAPPRTGVWPLRRRRPGRLRSRLR